VVRASAGRKEGVEWRRLQAGDLRDFHPATALPFILLGVALFHRAGVRAADWFGLPVSTTHVLSSGVAGAMAANRSGLQWATVRNLAMAWVLTLPIAICLSASLFWLFRTLGK